MNVDIKQVTGVDPIPLQPLTINPVTIASIKQVEKIAPAAVHIKELNQIAPISVNSLRVDHIRHVDPLRVERFNVTHLPIVNLSLSQLPALDLNVRRVPPVTIALGQQFEPPSRYTMRAKILGLELMRIEIDGRTGIVPKDCARREQSRSHERSFPDVAAAGNPAIPTKDIEQCVEAVTRNVPSPQAGSKIRWRQAPLRAAAAARAPAPAWPAPPQASLNAGAPRFRYSVAPTSEPAHSSVGSASSGD